MAIIPGQTWGRNQRQAGGKGKWHLLAEIRQNNSTGLLVGRWGDIPDGATFGVAICGMSVIDPIWTPAPKLKPYVSYHNFYHNGRAFPVPAASDNWCLPCVEAGLRSAGSRPI